MKRKEAVKLRSLMESAVQSLPDGAAAEAACLYPEWTQNISYPAGVKVRRDRKVYRVIQAHTSQAGWEPENVPALFEAINEAHAGTLADPIPYGGNMALTEGLHYKQSETVYRCIRSTGIPVYAALQDLVGLYVEVV